MSSLYRISIDPGTPSGYAVWDDKTFRELVPPIKWGVTDAGPKSEPWNLRTDITILSLQTLLDDYRPRVVYCEQPVLMAESVAGQAAARRGDLVKLAMAVGRINQICADRMIPFRLIDVARWKGQLSKEMVEKRIRRKLPDLEARSHAWDAVGIGLFVKGFF